MPENVLEHRDELINPSPMMQQYFQVKKDYLDYILFYRLGDFYEMFFEDAAAASKALELTLTGRDCGEGKRALMCGIPFHKADDYLSRMVESGYKVAVCEQMEDPATAKGIVKREVIRVITPGTITDSTYLSDSMHNYLCSFFYGKNSVSLGFADITTGELFVTEIEGEDRESRILNELGVYQPKEVISNVALNLFPRVYGYLTNNNVMLDVDSKNLFEVSQCSKIVYDCLQDDACKLKTDGTKLSVGALLLYVKETQKCEPTFVKELVVFTAGQYMELDVETRRNLELTEAMRTKERKGTLLWVLDKTQTCLGARLLRSWISRPLISAPHISNRLSSVEELTQNVALREELKDALKPILDLERLTARAVYGVGNAKDLRALATSISTLPQIKQLLSNVTSKNMQEVALDFDALTDIYARLNDTLVDLPPYSVREGGMIRDGFDTEIDYLRKITRDTDSLLKEMEERERNETGIRTLHVGYNKVFGFFIEVPRSQGDSVPAYYVRKQTLTTSERFITQELKELEGTVLGASEKLCAKEFELFTDLRLFVAQNATRIQKTASDIAQLDVYQSLANVAIQNDFVKPDVDLSDVIEIKEGRHPVVEKFVQDSYFVPNDTTLNTTNSRMMLITGPNMAGKSTYMRQVALMTIMAQIGSFVPAKSCHLGIVDRVFTRVGASDDLASGQSTFMLEMSEVANILKHATKHSLIVFDEVGRGTSTYDGMSIARAVVEYTASKKIGARTMFATHYHELTSMEGEIEGVVNYNIVAKKNNDTIIFLRKIVKGATDDSYGIEVAKLAGVPNEVIKRAREVLSNIENGTEIMTPKVTSHEEPSFDFFGELQNREADEVAKKLRETSLDTLTPIEAMNLLFELKKMLNTK